MCFSGDMSVSGWRDASTLTCFGCGSGGTLDIDILDWQVYKSIQCLAHPLSCAVHYCAIPHQAE